MVIFGAYTTLMIGSHKHLEFEKAIFCLGTKPPPSVCHDPLNLVPVISPQYISTFSAHKFDCLKMEDAALCK